MTIPDTFWQMAGMITALGMGVVFVALLLLSVYMHLFKLVTARIEGRYREKVVPVPKKTAAPPLTRAPKVAVAARSSGEEESRTAAAVAVALRLAGVAGAPSGEVAAAIAVALGMQRARSMVRLAAPATPFSGWRVSGRLSSMAARVARQERLGR